MTHVIHFQDRYGDVIDVEYFCSWSCMSARLKKLGVVHTCDPAAGQTRDYSWGQWPGGAETDYDVRCASCDMLLWQGLENRAMDDINGSPDDPARNAS